MEISQRIYVCLSFESVTVACVHCLRGVNPNQKRFFSYSILFAKPESWLFSNFLQRIFKITFQCSLFECIRKSLNSVTWGFVLSSKNVNQQAQDLNEILFFSNYIPNKWTTIYDKDLLWMNDEIKNKNN